jgi:hypothetical protein
MQTTRIRTYWSVIALIMLGLSYLFFLAGHSASADRYASAEWDKYLSVSYPQLSEAAERPTSSPAQIEETQALMRAAQQEMKPKLAEFRTEYDREHFGGVVRNWLTFNAVINVLVFAVYSLLFSRRATG